MKKLILLLVLISILTACKSKAPKTTETGTQKKDSVLAMPEIHTELYGNYVGIFEDAGNPDEISEENSRTEPVKISINITHITAKGADGRSIVRGNDRPMTGILSQSDNKYIFVMDEPGTDKHDGRFNFYIKDDSLIGKWEAYDKDAKGPQKKFALIKIPFQYNANLMLPKEWEMVDWMNAKIKNELYKNEDGSVDTIVNSYYRTASDNVYKLNASKQKLTEAQLKNLKKLDLEIIRNTIYARHGYAFKTKSVRQFFDQVDWYIPVINNVDTALSTLEKDNIALLKRFEKYAEDNYDTFGR